MVIYAIFVIRTFLLQIYAVLSRGNFCRELQISGIIKALWWPYDVCFCFNYSNVSKSWKYLDQKMDLPCIWVFSEGDEVPTLLSTFCPISLKTSNMGLGGRYHISFSSLFLEGNKSSEADMVPSLFQGGNTSSEADMVPTLGARREAHMSWANTSK